MLVTIIFRDYIFSVNKMCLGIIIIIIITIIIIIIIIIAMLDAGDKFPSLYI